MIMKKLLLALFAVTFCAVQVAQAGCMGGKCGVKKEKVERTRRVRGCASGNCGK